MRLVINGEDRTVEGVSTLAELVDRLGLDRRKLAIELDLEIIPRSLYEQTQLGPGSRIEIVHFVGGG